MTAWSSEASILAAPPTTSPPARPQTLGRRGLGVAILLDLVAVGVAYLEVHFPLVGPTLTGAQSSRYWVSAAIGAVVVAVGVLFVILAPGPRGRGSRTRPGERHGAWPGGEVGPPPAVGHPRVPRALRFERVPPRAVAGAAALSLASIPTCVLFGARLWVSWLAILAAWIPLVAVEGRWKCDRYGVFGCLALLGLLQILHMVEHAVQVVQLVGTHGDLTHAHGIIGQLDFELVHFVTDTTMWVSLGLMITMLHARSRWLWAAFAAASLHQVEHFYLFWLQLFHQDVYLAGGFAGIMGHGGLIGSPLDRPYLHFSYNLIVLVPLIIAVWDEARRVDRVEPRPARALA